MSGPAPEPAPNRGAHGDPAPDDPAREAAPDSLDGVLDDIWRHLTAGAASAKHHFHLPTLCTVAADQTVQARTVVLRGADRDTRHLMCHTDRRAAKAADIARYPAATWCFWARPLKLQVRVTSHAEVHVGDAVARRQWDTSSNSSRRCYLAPHPPGEPCDAPSPNLPEGVQGRVPTEAEVAPGFDNFAVVRARVLSLDALYLHHSGHRRAGFRWMGQADDGAPVASWLQV